MFKDRLFLFFQILICVVLLFSLLYLFSSCASAANAEMVSDNGIGAYEYRRVQTQQREGEAELAVTGTRLEIESREIRAGLGELERSIVESQGTEQEIGDILQRVREREVDPAFIEEWRNRETQTNSGG